MTVIELADLLYLGILFPVQILYNDESNTENDKRERHADIIVEILIEDIIEEDTYYRCRNAGDKDLEPHNELVLHYILSDAVLGERMLITLDTEGPYIPPEDDDDSKYRT